ncbi:hypothetical protein ACNF49_01660 [Actinomadura sp. ATCC 39365]
MHLGRLWTDGDPFLAVDASLRGAWRGFSGNQYDDIVDLGPERATFALKVPWYAQLDDENCFARWPPTPHEPCDQQAPW